MALWTATDDANGTLKLGAMALGTVTKKAVVYGNTTMSAFVPGQSTGIFGVSAAEQAIGAATVGQWVITSAGSGYTANAAVSVTGGGGTGATANAKATAGRITLVNANEVGSGFTSKPVGAIAAPADILFSGNSTSVTVGNSTVNGFITLGATNTAFLAAGDVVTYGVKASNTIIGGLANNATYYVIIANTTAVQLAATPGGGAINLASVTAGAQAGHFLKGETAAAVAVMGGAKDRATAGWNLRRVGSGGRAGRVSFEPLVAMRSLNNGTDDDTILPNS